MGSRCPGSRSDPVGSLSLGPTRLPGSAEGGARGARRGGQAHRTGVRRVGVGRQDLTKLNICATSGPLLANNVRFDDERVSFQVLAWRSCTGTPLASPYPAPQTVPDNHVYLPPGS